MQLPLTLDIRRSRRLLAALFLAHLLAGMGLWPVALPLWAKLGLWLALAVSFLSRSRQPPPAAMTLRSDGRLALTASDGTAHEYRVLPATTVLPWLVVLLVDSPAGRRALTLPPDALGGDGHRQLRSWLKWKASAGAA